MSTRAMEGIVSSFPIDNAKLLVAIREQAKTLPSPLTSIEACKDSIGTYGACASGLRAVGGFRITENLASTFFVHEHERELRVVGKC